MLPLKKVVTSSIGKKYVMGSTGLMLVAFVVVHLIGNLALLRSQGDAFNEYADALNALGTLLHILEIGLLGTILLHMTVALRSAWINQRARPVGYVMRKTKGGPSKWNLSSQHMVLTGLIIGTFLVFHVLQFHFGPGMAEGYVAQVKGKQMRDLYRLVYETFHSKSNVGIYVLVMIFLGFHLRHGFWSAFQSLGLIYPRLSKPIYLVGVLVAATLAVGFITLPLWIYFDIPKLLMGGT